MPLQLDAALAVGCVATVAPDVRSRPLSEGFDLTDLQASAPLAGTLSFEKRNWRLRFSTGACRYANCASWACRSFYGL